MRFAVFFALLSLLSSSVCLAQEPFELSSFRVLIDSNLNYRAIITLISADGEEKTIEDDTGLYSLIVLTESRLSRQSDGLELADCMGRKLSLEYLMRVLDQKMESVIRNQSCMGCRNTMLFVQQSFLPFVRLINLRLNRALPVPYWMWLQLRTFYIVHFDALNNLLVAETQRFPALIQSSASVYASQDMTKTVLDVLLDAKDSTYSALEPILNDLAE